MQVLIQNHHLFISFFSFLFQLENLLPFSPLFWRKEMIFHNQNSSSSLIPNSTENFQSEDTTKFLNWAAVDCSCSTRNEIYNTYKYDRLRHGKQSAISRDCSSVWIWFSKNDRSQKDVAIYKTGPVKSPMGRWLQVVGRCCSTGWSSTQCGVCYLFKNRCLPLRSINSLWYLRRLQFNKINTKGDVIHQRLVLKGTALNGACGKPLLHVRFEYIDLQLP